MAIYHEDEQNKLLADLKAGEEEALVRRIADEIGVPYQDLTGLSINTDALRLIPMKTACGADSPEELRKVIDREKLSTEEQQAVTEKMKASGEMAAYSMVGKKIEVAVKSPTNPATIAEVNRLESQGFETSLFMVSNRSLEKAWSRYNDISGSESSRGGLLDISDENLQEIAGTVHRNEDVQKRLTDIFETHDTHQISRIMETVFGSAIALKSSDVHFEPEETFTRLRLREDGVLQEIVQIEPDLYQRLLNRIKFISGMKLTNTETAQDGRFTIFYKGMEVEVRVAVAPSAYNESIVLRILNPEGLAVDFEKLGIEPKLFKVLEREIAKPNGMILTTGPTGSGKTTTLYSFLKKIYSPEIKIITIEDPIEYHLPGVTQEQVSHEKGFDFLAGLRAALRQDPDVIMVGEIRDKETATIAINASLTGHMVFSTLHTNNAAGTIPRLIDLGVQPGILAAALTVSIAQRLVRKLCPTCKKQAVPAAENAELLRSIIRNAERAGKDMASYGIRSDMDLVCYEPVGCAECNNTGFKGRVGLYEAILTDDIIANIMTRVPPPTERDIKRAAEHQKILTMIEDGVVKILTGVSSIGEVQGVVDLTEDVQENVGAQNPADVEDALAAAASTAGAGTDTQIAGQKTGSAAPDTQPRKNQGAAPAVEPRYADHAVPGGEEVALLVDYLKLLERLRRDTPSADLSDKIARASHMIISILENTPNLEALFAGASPGVVVRDEIEKLMRELSELQEDQEKNPSLDVASKISKIRNTIQTMRGEVAA